MYGWKQGLKTGSYYIRTAPAAEMQAFTLDPTETLKNQIEENNDKDNDNNNNNNNGNGDNQNKVWKCTMENGCEMCGS